MGTHGLVHEYSGEKMMGPEGKKYDQKQPKAGVKRAKHRNSEGLGKKQGEKHAGLRGRAIKGRGKKKRGIKKRGMPPNQGYTKQRRRNGPQRGGGGGVMA